jgi:hypothetical protein
VIRAAVFVVVLGAAACTADATDPGENRTTVCAGGARTQRIAVNGVQLNGVQLNGVQINRIALNGTTLAGVALEGDVAPAAGASVRGVTSDGTSVALVVASASGGLFELTHDGTNICEGDAKGVFVPGVWDERGAHHGSELSTFACTTGVIGKCVLWGYDPARVGTELHQTCTRMARADYCGDGVSWTRDGTPIDVFDTHGVQRAASEPGFLFEAGWTENGAACVNRPRFEGAQPPCWNHLPTCASTQEAQKHGASIMNASRETCQ